MDEITVVLAPEKVTATYLADRLIIHATGHEDGLHDITIERYPNVEPIEPPPPPAFRVVGERTPRIGMFPYAVTRVFEQPVRPAEIVIILPHGSERIPVV